MERESFILKGLIEGRKTEAEEREPASVSGGLRVAGQGGLGGWAGGGGSAGFPSGLRQVSQFPSWGSRRSLKSGTDASGSRQPPRSGPSPASFFGRVARKLDGRRFLFLLSSDDEDSSWPQLPPAISPLRARQPFS